MYEHQKRLFIAEVQLFFIPLFQYLRSTKKNFGSKNKWIRVSKLTLFNIRFYSPANLLFAFNLKSILCSFETFGLFLTERNFEYFIDFIFEKRQKKAFAFAVYTLLPKRHFTQFHLRHCCEAFVNVFLLWWKDVYRYFFTSVNIDNIFSCIYNKWVFPWIIFVHALCSQSQEYFIVHP